MKLEKTWQDMKKSAKRKNSQLKKYMGGTGGGPSRPLISEENEAVLNIMNTTSYEGDPNIQESDSRIIFEYEVDNGNNENVNTINYNELHSSPPSPNVADLPVAGPSEDKKKYCRKRENNS
ncbi:unnamed protein product [Brassicogethes aeneus]|uniref:Uncharacterized protein n=1 Tax=Brassicogethes aeneus TaxID=1431903 RepID=A0A9P0BGQ5_BRAAE|nr:unnamed protein product [Brassicogethes aeneus]